MQQIRVGQLGARMYYGVARALYRKNLLECLYTDFTINKGPLAILHNAKLLRGALKKISNRNVEEIQSKYLHHLPDYGARLSWKLKQARSQAEKNSINYYQGLQLENAMMKDGLKGVGTVVIVGSSSENIFRYAKSKGITTVQENISSPAKICKEIIISEIETYGNWQKNALNTSSFDFWQEINEREWQFADHIICGSQFVKDAIFNLSGPVEKVTILPYGIPEIPFHLPIKTWDGKRKLRILFCGSVSLSKGAHYLIQASKFLHENCEIKLCGQVQFNSKVLDNFTSYIKLLGHVSRSEIGKHYEWADIFVLPSLFEGSATVGYEAIQYNLPMIVTPNSGQFIEDQKHGFIINVKSINDIIQSIQQYIEDPNLVEQHSLNVRELKIKASFEAYAERLGNFFSKIV